jgi:predicted glycoside hydrolase/deacetylase ChbG (UPF0249 family)
LFSLCSFGVHLNLTVFPPLQPSPQLKPILDADGSLSPKLFKTQLTPQLRRAIFDELTAQVERALSAGIPVSHFDSHQHIHTLPMLFPVLKALQRRFGIRRVRSTINFRELELMVHPGTTAPIYMHEVALLRSDWRRRLPSGIAFGNYYSIS